MVCNLLYSVFDMESLLLQVPLQDFYQAFDEVPATLLPQTDLESPSAGGLLLEDQNANH